MSSPPGARTTSRRAKAVVLHGPPPSAASAVRDRVRARLDLGQVALGVLVDEPDRRAREDVVELLQEQQLPEPVELGARIVAARGGGEELRVVKRDLRAPVAALRPRLRRVGAAVVLEVELAEDDGRSPGSASSASKNSSRRAIVVRGRPWRSRARSSVSIISRVGPPPPSPKP